jgi:2-haloacid dehalogenase
MLVIFDMVGTVFSLSKVRSTFQKKGIGQPLMDLWFSRLLQGLMASTLAGRYCSFGALARSTLEQVFAQNNIRERYMEDVLESLQEIEPWDDARDCIHTLQRDGHRLIAMSNNDLEGTERLLLRSGLRKSFDRLYSADITKACKPHHALYELLFRTVFAAPYECCMVSAHGWDILGAGALGMNTVYVNRLEQQWAFPDPPEGFTVANLHEVPELITRTFGKPLDSAVDTDDPDRHKRHGAA